MRLCQTKDKPSDNPAGVQRFFSLLLGETFALRSEGPTGDPGDEGKNELLWYSPPQPQWEYEPPTTIPVVAQGLMLLRRELATGYRRVRTVTPIRHLFFRGATSPAGSKCRYPKVGSQQIIAVGLLLISYVHTCHLMRTYRSASHICNSSYRCNDG